MENHTPEEKQTYQASLRAACAAWWEETFITPGHVGSHEVSEKEIYELVKAIALDSFKNGVTVGKRKAQTARGERQEQEEEGD